jgi:Rrf2 family transcriptional regulator, iron-sulfur cluster assembly transcription factor
LSFSFLAGEEAFMLSLSQTTGYAILALGFMHECGGRLVLAKDITSSTGIPLPYLSKILNALTRTGMIVGKRGYQGGFALSRSADEINLCDVAEAVEGHNWLPNCPLGITGCSKKPQCPIHDFWMDERAKILKEMRCISLAEISAYVSEKFLSNVDGCYVPGDSNPPPVKNVKSPRTGRRKKITTVKNRTK